MSVTSFAEFKLHSQLEKAVEAAGYITPTEIQRQAIPIVLSGRDLMASAQTGTGKTAAFVLPALQRLLTPSKHHGRGPRVLVLTPTRELAAQVNEDIRKFSRFGRFTTGNVLGGVPYPPQIRLLAQPLDLLVATPGRLMDHMRENRVDFSRLEMFVLDEADRMLDMGFINDVKTIACAIPTNRQTLLFSATLEGRVLTVGKDLMREPVKVQLTANRDRHALIRQHVYHADNPEHKHRLLAHHLSDHAMTQAVIFTATKRRANRLAKTLAEDGHKSAALHGDMRMSARRRTMEHMREGKVRLLVATDVAARGLDIKGISHVINFDLPMVAEDYIHRIGRTGRAGAKGTAITLVGPEDWSKLAEIEKLTGRTIERDVITGLEPTTTEPRRGPARGGRSHGSTGHQSQARPQGRTRSGNRFGFGAQPRRRQAWKTRGEVRYQRGVN